MLANRRDGMQRHYFVSDDLSHLQAVERDLLQADVQSTQIYVLSEDNAGMEQRRLNEVEAVLKKDVVHGTELGALIGAVGAVLVIALAWASGIAQAYTWIPPIFLAIVILGFCTWEGGLIGISEPHYDFKRFREDLDAGRHIMLVDNTEEQETAVKAVAREHPELRPAGSGNPRPRWFITAQQNWASFLRLGP